MAVMLSVAAAACGAYAGSGVAAIISTSADITTGRRERDVKNDTLLLLAYVRAKFSRKAATNPSAAAGGFLRSEQSCIG